MMELKTGDVVETDKGPALVREVLKDGRRLRLVLHDGTERILSHRRVRRTLGQHLPPVPGWEERWRAMACDLHTRWVEQERRSAEERERRHQKEIERWEDFRNGMNVCPRCGTEPISVESPGKWEEFLCLNCSLGLMRDGVHATGTDLAAERLERELDSLKMEYQRQMDSLPRWREDERISFLDFLRSILRPGAYREAMLVLANRREDARG